MISNNTQAIIDKAIAEGMAIYYVIIRMDGQMDADGYPDSSMMTETSRTFAGTDYAEAQEIMHKMANETTIDDFNGCADFDLFCVELDAAMAEIIVDDSELTDFDTDDADCLDSDTAYYHFKSLEGCILCFWSWQKHIGYARKFEEVREAYCDETEQFLVPKDQTFVRQCSVVATKEQLEGLSAEEKKDVVMRELENMGKWQNGYEYYVNMLFGLNEEED